MKRQDYLGSTTGSAQEELQRTIRRSRRLALKRRRERRRSVGEALGLTPGRDTHHRGNNLRQDAAEQLALSIATRDQQRGNERERRDRTRHKSRRDSGRSVATATWGLTRDGRRRTTEDHFNNLFNTPLAGSTDSTEDSNSTDEPNTEDRQFIKPDGEEESDPEYEPTDPAEFSMTSERDARARSSFRPVDQPRQDKQWRHTKGRDDESKRDDGAGLPGIGDLLAPPESHSAFQPGRAPTRRQLTPEFEKDEGINNYATRTNPSGSPRSHERTARKHTQEVRRRGEVGTYDPFLSPVGSRATHASKGEVDTHDPFEKHGQMSASEAKRGDTPIPNLPHGRGDRSDRRDRSDWDAAKNRVAQHAPRDRRDATYNGARYRDEGRREGGNRPPDRGRAYHEREPPYEPGDPGGGGAAGGGGGPPSDSDPGGGEHSERIG